MSRVAQFFIGVDLHKTVIQVCVLDGSGQTIEERRHVAEDLVDGLKVIGGLMKYRDRGRFAVEAIGLNRWFVNAMQERGFDVIVCDPTKLNLKMLGRKTDRRDAHEIARRLLLGDIDRNATTYYPEDQEYGMRKVIRARHRLVQTHQMITNQIRSLLNAYKVTGLDGSLMSRRSLFRLRRMTWPTPELAVVMQTFIGTLEDLTRSICYLDQQLSSMARDPVVRSLKHHLPSVGTLTAVVLVCELGDVSRFRNSRAVASYAGLVPRVNQSADTAHHGSLTKRGNRELRYILGQWAVRLMSGDERVKAWAEPRLRRSHKNKVRVALARRLLIGVYRMMVTGEVFSMERCLAVQK